MCYEGHVPYYNPPFVPTALGMDWNGFPKEFLEELHVKLSEKGGIELRKAVVKGVRNTTEMRKRRNTE